MIIWQTEALSHRIKAVFAGSNLLLSQYSTCRSIQRNKRLQHSMSTKRTTRLQSSAHGCYVTGTKCLNTMHGSKIRCNLISLICY